MTPGRRGARPGGAIVAAADRIISPFESRRAADLILTAAALGALPGGLFGGLWWWLWRRHARDGSGGE